MTAAANQHPENAVTNSDDEPIIERFPRERTQLLPLLLAVQEHDGHLSESALREIARHVYVPESDVFGVATSYSELRFSPPDGRILAVCTGLSCLLAGARDLAPSLSAALPEGWSIDEHPCRFRCADAPVVAVDRRYVDGGTREAVLAAVAAPGARPTWERTTRPPRNGEVRRLLARCGSIDPASIDDALAGGAYAGLRTANTMEPAAIVRLVEEAGLLGRGGAYFPVASKWSGARAHPRPRYFVVNAEEGEPGVFKDRHLIEGDPHLLVEGIFIAARAIEADAVYVYVNGEAALAAERLAAAIEQARSRGLLGDGAPAIEIRRGAGGYVCGEESVILSSIEGQRAVPRLRPPFPVEAGLFGRPTVINNVETLCNLPFILRHGAAAFRSVGTAEHPGTKLVCLSGALRDPGVYEVPCGTPLRHIIDVIAGGPAPGRTIRALLCGGPSGTLLPPGLWGAPLAPGQLDESGASPGAGGIVAIDDTMSIRDVVRHLTAYNADESCGKCTPCREGTARMRDLLDEFPAQAAERLDELSEAVSAASLCGLGQMAPLPYLSARRHFAAELQGDVP
ncbi:MAG: NADH-ubiquinone oxidoreductase-F iron-sulfur binding region domain-containing protein [Vicinamibacterales bacterium]